jgi:hypothetical protein
MVSGERGWCLWSLVPPVDETFFVISIKLEGETSFSKTPQISMLHQNFQLVYTLKYFKRSLLAISEK